MGVVARGGTLLITRGDPTIHSRFGVEFARMKTYLDGLARDFRYALRNLRKSRRFSLIAIFALALGIGASSVVFSVVYNVFFHALPYKDFDRSVVFEIRNTANAAGSKGSSYFSPAEFRAFREQNHVFEDMIAHGVVSRLFYDDGKSTRVLPSGATVSSNTFDYLGVPPLLGRRISEEDARPGAPLVFVMNYRLWQREFGGDPRILGKSFILRGTPRTLVGIMPARFRSNRYGHVSVRIHAFDVYRPRGRGRGNVDCCTALKHGCFETPPI
jgi:MacB-like periplasmic core domain